MVRAIVRRLPLGSLKFAFTGGLVALVGLASMTLQLAVLGLPGQLALVITYIVSTTLHFSMNRRWVWHGEGGYRHHLTAQGRRYLAVVGVSYGTNAAALAWLPGWLDVPQLAVYFVTTMVLALIGYVALRHWVFPRTPVPANRLPSEL
jgi:putative flippase GtrA